MRHDICSSEWQMGGGIPCSFCGCKHGIFYMWANDAWCEHCCVVVRKVLKWRRESTWPSDPDEPWIGGANRGANK